MSALYSISVVIPTYKRCAAVHRVLQALARQTLPASRYEVIVAIDGSEDGTREFVRAFPAPYPLHCLWQPNQGRATACNAGIRAATGALIVLLDDDMEPSPELLQAHLAAHGDRARLGVMGAVPISVGAGSAPVVKYVGAKFNAHLQKLAQPDYQLQLRDFYSGNFSIRRDLLLEVGLFDEAFKLYGNEDVELSLRLTHAGVQLVYSAEALAQQHYTKNFGGLARDTLAKGETSVVLAAKHPNTLGDLKLSSYCNSSPRWRMVRALLLRASRLYPRLERDLVTWSTWLEQLYPAGMQRYYPFVLDYYFWLGALRALREHPQVRQRLPALAVIS